ncbi:hypothetical protein OAF27_00665 [Verrucomicrobiales bacterium]|nr:hypothetical protein [Verrucomicrobiales bacterium]
MKSVLIRWVIGFTVPIVFFGVAILLFFQPGPSGVVAALRLKDGSEYMVIQNFEWSPEPYDVALYTRESGGLWSRSYVDHEASRWFDVKMTYDSHSDLITVTKWGKKVLEIDRATRKFWNAKDGGRVSELPAVGRGDTPDYPFPDIPVTP